MHKDKKRCLASITTLHHQHKPTDKLWFFEYHARRFAMKSSTQLNGTTAASEQPDTLALTYTLNDFGINNITTLRIKKMTW
ncbi:hypothetical protein O9993_15980 [Vibrio lentus]|nr:hypothetical protein [Vibrio lentus]